MRPATKLQTSQGRPWDDPHNRRQTPWLTRWLPCRGSAWESTSLSRREPEQPDVACHRTAGSTRSHVAVVGIDHNDADDDHVGQIHRSPPAHLYVRPGQR